MWRKVTIGLSTVFGIKPSLAASLTAGIAGAVMVDSTDPIQFAICIGGMVVVTAYSKSTTRFAIFANLLISLFLGMVAAETVAALVTTLFLPDKIAMHPRLAAGILAGGWPWLFSMGRRLFDSRYVDRDGGR